MTKLLQIEATITDAYQTTVPELVCKTLGLEKKDKICYTILADGSVTISRSDKLSDDCVLSNFLNFLAQDIQENSHNIQPINSNIFNQVQSLLGDISIDLNEALTEEEEE